MKNSEQLTEEIAKEFSVSSSDEVALRAKIHRLKEAIIDEFASEVKNRVIWSKPTYVSLGYGDFGVFNDSQEIANITDKQADDYDNQSEEKRQRG